MSLISAILCFAHVPILVTIHGSTWGGSMLKQRFIGRGMQLEFHHSNYSTPIVTSPICPDVLTVEGWNCRSGHTEAVQHNSIACSHFDDVIDIKICRPSICASNTSLLGLSPPELFA